MLHHLHLIGWFEGNASGIEGDPLTHKNQRWIRLRSWGHMFQNNDRRGFLTSLRYCQEGPHAEFLSHDHIDDLETKPMCLRQFTRRGYEEAGRHLIGRSGSQVAGQGYARNHGLGGRGDLPQDLVRFIFGQDQEPFRVIRRVKVSRFQGIEAVQPKHAANDDLGQGRRSLTGQACQGRQGNACRTELQLPAFPQPNSGSTAQLVQIELVFRPQTYQHQARDGRFGGPVAYCSIFELAPEVPEGRGLGQPGAVFLQPALEAGQRFGSVFKNIKDQRLSAPLGNRRDLPFNLHKGSS